MLKVLQINNCHYPRGGADIVYLNTGRLLEKYGNRVVYFSQNNSKNQLEGLNEFFINRIDFINASLLQKIRSFPRFFYSGESKHKISRLIEKFNPDIAHIHLYKGDLTSSILHSLKKYNVPVVLTLHDYGLLCPHNLLLDGNDEICHKCINKSALNCIVNKCNRGSLVLSTVSAAEYIFNNAVAPFDRYFQKIIAVSKFGQKLHNDSLRLKKKVIHLYNFFPNITVSPDHSKGSYFLFYGRLSKEKGIKTLIHSWQTKSRQSTLKIVGTGPMMEEIKQQIKSDNIEILGFKTGEELSRLIRNASFIIVPSEWYENNPLTIVESYANGKPVIGSRVGGIPEIIIDGKTGFTFEMRSVTDLSEKLDLAEKMSIEDYRTLSENARLFAEEHFHPDKHYDTLMQIYSQTIEENGQKIKA